MYDIVTETITTANGLEGEMSEQGANLLNTGITTTGNMITSLVNSKNEKKIAEANAEAAKYNAEAAKYGSMYVGGNTSTYSPTSSNTGGYVITAPAAEKKDYTPWLIGGGIAIAGLLLIMTMNNRRR